MKKKVMQLKEEQVNFLASLSHLAYKTKQRYGNYLTLFLEWLVSENLYAGQVRTTDILAFIDGIKKDYSPEQRYRIIYTLKVWYHYKKYNRNPASGIKIRYKKTKLPSDILSREVLDTLYHSYEATTLLGYRNKVIIGLLVFQGLSTGDLKRLRTRDIKLNTGQIYIRSSKQTNSRTLDLKACQILALQTYLSEFRPQFNKATDQFIIHRKGQGTGLQNVINHLFGSLRKQNQAIKHAGQIRQSVLTDWLKSRDVRIVQYMAGHKQVKSTERYQSLHLEDLQEQLNKFHPLG